MDKKIFNENNVFLDYAFLFRIKLIEELLGDVKLKKVADIGCGRGYVSFLLWLIGAEVYSIDVSKNFLQATRNLSRLNANFKPDICQSDASNLPFVDGVFDVICCFETLEHLCDDKNAVQEMAKITKSGGRVIISVPFDARLAREKKNQRTRVKYRKYNFETLRKLFPCEQFRLERTIFWGFPTLKILNLIKLRKIFSALGFLIGFIGKKNYGPLNDQKRYSFFDGLARFYYTRFWRDLMLPLVLRLLFIFDRFFQNLPLSDDVFLIFRKI